MKSLIVTLVTVLVLFFTLTSTTYAASLEECDKEDIPSDKVGECIEILSEKVADLGNQKKTLAAQISQFDSQIQLTQLRISEAEKAIEQLEKEIGVLGFRIEYITDSVDNLETLLKQRIVATYQQSFVSNFEIILSSSGFSELILRTQYLKQVQEADKKLLANLLSTKSNYANQKDERVEKQAAIEENKQKLLGLKTNLDQQKAEKQVFLRQTQNDESRYQQLLAQAQAELAIAFGGGTETFIRDVKTGDAIGTIINGKSGCSTGRHLHFEVHQNGSIKDPNDYLSSTSYDYPYGEGDSGSINPRGSFPWPISSPIHITQGYGMTPYANSGSYNGNPHFGIDMYTESLTVKAVKDGKLYGGSYSGCSYGPLIYAKIKHDNGLDTLYLHMIPN
ncbi:MAG: hypothetical protein NUV69_04840 [Candidatus Curtissbacteria bacterium]|nr:hypothetical protein [Candidatus Curtissbacteria bacterium]